MNFAGFSEASLNILEREIQKKNTDFLHEHEPLISTLKENYWLIGWGQENYQKKKKKKRKTSDASKVLQILLSSSLCLYHKNIL